MEGNRSMPDEVDNWDGPLAAWQLETILTAWRGEQTVLQEGASIAEEAE